MSTEPPVEKPRSLTAAWVALALLFAFLGWFKWESESDKAACFLITRNAQQSVRSYCGMNGLNVGDAFDRRALFGPGKFLKSEPVCPAGGTYTWSTNAPLVGGLAIRCSHRKHQLDPAFTADW